MAVSVTGRSPEEVRRARDELVPVVRRGIHWRVRWTAKGEGDCLTGPQDVLAARGKRSDPIEDCLTAFVLFIAVEVAIWVSIRSVTKGHQPIHAPSLSTLVAGAVIALLAAGVLAGVRRLRPAWSPILQVWHPIEISENPVIRSVLKLVTKVVPTSAGLAWLAHRVADLFD